MIAHRLVVPRERYEEALAVLIDAVGDGFEERAGANGDVEFVVYGTGVVPDVAPWFQVSSVPVADGWETRWREFHRPVRIGRFVVGGSWHEGLPDDAIRIDPGAAFGTGAHGSTRATGELLAALPTGSLVDLGCGSGVLTLIAARLGHRPLVALDIDPRAVEVCAANLEAHGVVADCRVIDALRDPLPIADAALANLERRLLEPLLRRADLPPVLVVSGLLAGEPLVRRAYRVERALVRDGWRAELLRRGG